MNYWDKYPSNYRLLIGSVSAILLSLILYNFVDIAQSVTDENLYSDPQSRFYIQNEIKGKIIIRNDKSIEVIKSHIPNGSILIGINDLVYNSELQLKKFLNVFRPEDTLRVIISNINLRDSTNNIGVKQEYLVSRSDFPDSAFTYLPSAVLVNEVKKDGVSDKAGLKAGDLIVKINNERFRNALDAHYLMIKSNKSELIYEVLNDSQTKIIKIKLASYGVSLTFLFLLIIGLIIFSIGVYISLNKPKLKAARLTGMSLILLGYVISFGFTAPNLQYLIYFAENRYIFSVFIQIFSISVILHSLNYFPTEKKSLTKKKYIIYTPYIFSIICAIILILEYSKITQHGFLSYLFYPGVLILVIIRIIINIIYKYKNKNKSQIKGRAVLWAYTISIIYIIIVITNNTFLHFHSFPAFSIFILLLIPLAYLYTIAKYGLFDLSIKLKRNIQHNILTILLNLILFTFLIFILYIIANIDFYIPNLHFTGTSLEVVDNPLSPELKLIYEKFILLIFSLISALIIFKLKGKIQGYLDKKFHIVKFDYRKAADEIQEIMQHKMALMELSVSILNKLVSLLHLKRAGILFFDSDDKIIAQNYYGLNDYALKEYIKAVETPLFNSVSEFTGYVLIEYLPSSIKPILQECDFKFLIPIRTKGKVLGAIIIGEKMSESQYHNEDFNFLQSIASQATVAIENSLLYEDLAKQERMKQELEIARRIQLSSLPNEVPKIEGFDISGMSKPALEVGGDFYDLFDDIENQSLTAVIGDVSGKGTSAALYMSKIQGILRTLIEFKPSPKEILIKANNLIFRYLEKSSFITALVLSIDYKSKSAFFSRAGHLPLYIYRAEKQKVEKYTPKGIVIGMNNGDLFDRNLIEEKITFESNDVFVLLTDGITEARDNADNEYQEERLIDLIEKKAFNNADEIRNSLINSVQEFSGNEDQFDDITVVIIKIN